MGMPFDKKMKESILKKFYGPVTALILLGKMIAVNAFFIICISFLVLNCAPTKYDWSKKEIKNEIDELLYSWSTIDNHNTRSEIILEFEKRKAVDALITCNFTALSKQPTMSKPISSTFIIEDVIVVVQALGRLKDPSAIESLAYVVRRSNNKQLKLAALHAYNEINDPKAIFHISGLVNDADQEIRVQAIDTLGHFKTDESIETIFKALFDDNPNVRWKAVHTLGEINNPKATRRISVLLADENKAVRNEAEVTLRKFGVSEEKIQDWKSKAEQLSIEDVYHAKLKYQKVVVEKQILEKKLKLESSEKLDQLSKPRKTVEKTSVDKTFLKESTKSKPFPYPDIDFGSYSALIIGNNNYQHLPQLKTAQNDAKEVAETLKDKYGFKVKLLLNANRSDILLALANLRWNLNYQDNLLIYYAGHGWLDKEADEGYWLPINAEKDNTINWISNSSITSTLRAIRAKHVLIVADSCYSGKLARGIHTVHREPGYLSRLAQKRARSVISSGGLEPVLDSGGRGEHSVFTSAFLDALQENVGIMDGAQLFNKLRRPVMLDSDQTPEYSDIRKTGHEGGEFLFVRIK
jgi:hypothetical protein